MASIGAECCDPPTTSSLNSDAPEALGKSSQSLQLDGDISFSQTNRGRALLMINGFSYTLNTEKKISDEEAKLFFEIMVLVQDERTNSFEKIDNHC